MPSILADFTRLHRGAALPLDLTDDRQYWQYIQRWYSGLAALRGIDVWEQTPFNQDGNPGADDRNPADAGVGQCQHLARTLPRLRAVRAGAPG